MKRRAIGTAVAALLASCGGGGSESWPPAFFPVAGTFEKALAGPLDVILHGPQGAVIRIIREPTTPTGTRVEVFEQRYGGDVHVVMETIRPGQNGSWGFGSSRFLFYWPQPLRLLGANSGGGHCDFIDNWPGLTNIAVDGESFTFYVADSRAGSCSADDPITKSSSGTWRVERDSIDTAFVCLTIDTLPPSGGEEQCYRVNTAGDILGMRVRAYVAGRLMTFQ